MFSLKNKVVVQEPGKCILLNCSLDDNSAWYSGVGMSQHALESLWDQADQALGRGWLTAVEVSFGLTGWHGGQ